jgi:hypothetical protein
MLDYATIMHTSYPSCDQNFHQDAPFPEGMRVQLPLMDVPLDLGPIQIKPEMNAYVEERERWWEEAEWGGQERRETRDERRAR